MIDGFVQRLPGSQSAPFVEPEAGRSEEVVISIGLGVAVFVLLSAIMLTALYFHGRLGDDLLSQATHDAVKIGIGVVVVLSALVLGLLIASAKANFDTAGRDLKRFSTEVVLLDRTLRAYGPEVASARNTLQAYVERALAGTWPTGNSPEVVDDPQAEQLIYGLQDSILSLAPQNPRQTALIDELRGEVRRFIELRWTLVGEATSSLNIPLVGVLLVWLSLVFASFGYNAPRNAVVIITFVLCAACMGGAMFLILQMDRPFEGVIKVSPAPLEKALAHIRQ